MSTSLKEMLRVDRAVFDNFQRNVALKAELPSFAFPPIELMMETQNHWNYENFYKSGRIAAEFYLEFINKYFDRADTIRILEWGCGPARVIRHVAESIGARGEFWATDYDEMTIAWCRQNITGISFSSNRTEPPLTFDNDFFDLIYCRSVFTHLPIELGRQWLAELCRCTKPGGLVSFTMAGYGVAERLTDEERRIFDDGNPVVRESGSVGSKLYATWYPPQYIEQIFAEGHKIEERILYDNPGTTQDVWLIRA